MSDENSTDFCCCVVLRFGSHPRVRLINGVPLSYYSLIKKKSLSENQYLVLISLFIQHVDRRPTPDGSESAVPSEYNCNYAIYLLG